MRYKIQIAMKNRIKVIFTGGTIGSAISDGVVSLSGGSAGALLDSYRRERGDDITFDAEFPVNLHSEDVTPDALYAIYGALSAVDARDYDGVIVTHGTDTLDFTANYLAATLSDYPLPVALVSSDYPLDDPRSNGAKNFAAAVDFIRANLPGIYVVFANPGEDAAVHLASRLIAPEEMTGRMRSLCGVPLGTVRNGKFVRALSPLNPADEELRDFSSRTRRAATLCADVVTLDARALTSFALFDFNKTRPRAVILGLYHSGTFCTKGENFAFPAFAEKCAAAGIPVIIAPVDSAANVYASAGALPPLVAVSPDQSAEITRVKVMLALAAGMPPESMLKENLFFEKVRTGVEK